MESPDRFCSIICKSSIVLMICYCGAGIDARPTRVVNFGDDPVNVDLSLYSYTLPNGSYGTESIYPDLNGGNGGDGKDGASLILKGKHITLTGSLALPGGNGGVGASGLGDVGALYCLPNGGNGGKGGKGGEGGRVKMQAETIIIPPPIDVSISVDGGNGGDGGGGGMSCNSGDPFCNTVGQPGNGGNGGDGGRAGKIQVEACYINRISHLLLFGSGGNGGNGGSAGSPWYADYMRWAQGKFGLPGNGGNSYLCDDQEPSSVYSVPGGAGQRSHAWTCYDPENPQPFESVYGPPGSSGSWQDGGCPVKEVELVCNPNLSFGIPYDTDWINCPSPFGPGFPDPGPSPGPEDPPPPPGPGNPGPEPPVFPPNPSCGTCGINLLSDDLTSVGLLLCNSVISENFITTAGEVYCSPVNVPGEESSEQAWPDRVWTISPTAGTVVKIRAYTYNGPYHLAVGKLGNLSSEGLVRSYGERTSEISFTADGSTYFVTLAAWFCAEEFKLQAICCTPSSPPNDEYSSATVVSCGYTIAGVPITTYATPSAVTLPPNCSTAKDVWYKINVGPGPGPGLEPGIGVVFDDGCPGATCEHTGFIAIYWDLHHINNGYCLDSRYGRINGKFVLTPIPATPNQELYVRVASNSPSTSQSLQITCHPKTY